ncbi:MAG: hypothetical protein IJI42_10495 [Methanobrevibacter sp.]|nr:hypothetical protein [Candidatus Saccharibacteria bacterium]MBQ3476455.1 hypothetical protein [Candidatus Saccharibacteria bacterium]MBQ3642569.1 hypothetical protein [bacterium]MBQ6351347.1 hypothetical protein [Methanobrevibacter sp.]MBR0371508.1 hypothetical protein [Methanobrevibacter sp.]
MVNRRKRNKNWIIWLLFLVLVIVAGAICYLVWDNYFNDKTIEIGESKYVEKDKKENENIINEEDEAKSNGENDEKKVVQYEGNDPNLNEELSGSVTYAGIMNDKITIRVNIDQYLSEGNCTLSLISDETVVYNENVKIINSASTATCEGFDIPVSNMGEGNYDIVIKLSSGDKIGSIKGEIRI